MTCCEALLQQNMNKLCELQKEDKCQGSSAL